MKQAPVGKKAVGNEEYSHNLDELIPCYIRILYPYNRAWYELPTAAQRAEPGPVGIKGIIIC